MIILFKYSKYIINSLFIYSFKNRGITSRIFSVPIYLGSGNEYYCCIRFLLYKKFNTLDIQWINFVGKDIEQSDIYKQLFLKVTD